MEGAVATPLLCPILIGRTAELTSLHALLERAKSGQGQMALLSGEAGIGKSRLVREIAGEASCQGFLVLQGSCFPTDRTCPYAPLLDLLRALSVTPSWEPLLTDLGPLTSALSPLIPELVPPPAQRSPASPSDPEQEKRRLFAAPAHLFTSQVAQQPVLLVVEDLHWSDDSSLELLHYLARRCAAHPLLLLLTYRSDEVHPNLSHLLAHLGREWLSQDISLARLSHQDTGTMLQTMAVGIFQLAASCSQCS